MTYEEFTDMLKSRLQSELSYAPESIKFYPEGFTSDDPKIFDWIIDTNKRYSGKESPFLLKDFFVLKRKDYNGIQFFHRIDLRATYEQCEAEGFEAAFDGIRVNHNSVFNSGIDTELLSRRGSAGYDEMKSHLIIRPLNYSLHMNELKDCVYDRIGDITFVLYHFIGDSGGSLASSKIHREELERWGMSDKRDEVMRAALENTARLFPACVYDNKKGEEVDFLSAEIPPDDMRLGGVIMLSTFKVTNGAMALFYPGVAEKMRTIMGGSFLAVFMNINDIMILERDDPSVELYAEFAKNPSGNELGEMLSARVFLCDEKGLRPA